MVSLLKNGAPRNQCVLRENTFCHRRRDRRQEAVSCWAPPRRNERQEAVSFWAPPRRNGRQEAVSSWAPPPRGFSSKSLESLESLEILEGGVLKDHRLARMRFLAKRIGFSSEKMRFLTKRIGFSHEKMRFLKKTHRFIVQEFRKFSNFRKFRNSGRGGLEGPSTRQNVFSPKTHRLLV